MQYRQLGTTDLMVSRICFGCWQLSPSWWGEVPLDPWAQAVKAALDSGVNFIDTADAYGDGYAESELGKLMESQGYRDQFIVATKFFWNFADGPKRFPDTTYDYIIRACEASLTRLRTDRIDLYQIHSWDALTRPDEVAAALLRLKREGKIRWIGVSNQNPEQMEMYGDHFAVSCLQPPYSLLARDIEARELPYCLRKNIGVIPYSPMFRGLLAGKYTVDTTFDEQRANHPLFRGEGLRIMIEALEETKAIAASLDLTMPQLAIRWVLTQPAVTAAIVGIKKAEHVTSIVKAADGALPQNVWHDVAGILKTAQTKAMAASA